MKTVLTWMFAGGSFALFLFFLTPASPGAKWQLSARPQMETGLPLEPVVDLNMIGELKVNRDVAFEVFASYPEGGSKDDLNPNTYWRATAYNEYENGRWTQAQVGHLFGIRDQFSSTTTLPDLGPGQYYLDFRPTPKLVREVFAEPLCWTPGQASPIISIGLTTVRPWRQLPNGWFVPLVSTTGRIVRYRQAMKPVTDPNIGPPNELLPPAPFARVGPDALPPLREARMPRLRDWAEARVREFVGNGKLPTAVLERAKIDPVVRRLQIDPQDYERVALVFRDYFARSGGFTYALKLSREDTSLDPIEDFVFNTKAGHCERFASAFALSLRTIGIPCSFVLGYHGCDFEGEGKYVVRQENAHAWVSVLVPRPTPENFATAPRLDGLPPQPPENVWSWLTVDPTPSGEDIASTAGPTTWWQSAHLTGQAFYNDFIIGYDAERRRQISQSIVSHLASYWWVYLGGIAGIIGLVAGVISVRRMTGPPQLPPVVEMTGIVTIPWYAHAVNALEAAGFPMQTGQTPLEYANRIAAMFREHPDTTHLGSDMLELTEALYRSRYAGATLPAFEVDALTAAAERVAGGIRMLVPKPVPEASNV